MTIKRETMMPKWMFFGCALLCASPALAAGSQQNSGKPPAQGDINISIDAKDITTFSSGGNSASVNIGGIGEGVSVQGVTVINGKVWIDGVEIPPGVKRHRSKSGTVYRIERKNGAVSVSEE